MSAQAKTFSQWMRHIAREHEDQIQAELAAAALRARRAKIRRICYSVATVILMAIAIRHRSEIGRGIYALTLEKLETKHPGEVETEVDQRRAFQRDAKMNFGSNMKAIQGVASERDRLLDEFSRR